MKRHIIFYLLLLVYSSLSAQNILTLEECQELARVNYPIAKQLDLIDKTKKIKLSNLTHAWLPKLSVSTTAITTTGFPDIKPLTDGLKEHDFLASMSVNLIQPIWDGGISSVQNKIIKANAEVQKADMEVSLHKHKEYVAEIYFGVILLQKKLEISNKSLQLIRQYAERGRVLNNNGTMSHTDLKNIEIEVLRQEQQVATISSDFIGSIKILGLLVGKELPEDINLIMPVLNYPKTDVLPHPMFRLFSSQEKYISTQKKLVKMQCLPRLSLNASFLGLTPTPKIINNNTSHLWYAGITLSWNINPLYSLQNNLTDLEIKQQHVSSLKSSFDLERDVAVEKEKGEIDRLSHLLKKDNEIIMLSEEIASIAESELRNGTINTTDFLKAINELFQAKHVMAMHEIELLHHQYKQIIILNQLD